MVAAKVCLFKRQPIREIEKKVGVSRGQIGYASIVLQYRADLADLVISGAMALNEAYEKAQDSKKTGESEESRTLRLQRGAPDLARTQWGLAPSPEANRRGRVRSE
jgi:hypothetical protein